MHRKNSLYYRTKNGAWTSDVLSSILFSAKENKIDSIKYLTDLLKYKDLLEKNPENWLPWKYTKTMEMLNNSPLPPQKSEATEKMEKAIKVTQT